MQKQTMATSPATASVPFFPLYPNSTFRPVRGNAGTIDPFLFIY
jgi:hypothetical protein